MPQPSPEPDQPSRPRFVWPPEPTGETPTPPPATQPISPSSRCLPHPLLESIELDLLGRTGLAFDRWAERTGWARDDVSDYCWRCGGSVGPHETDGEGCSDCRTKALPWDRALRLSRYQGVIRDEVLALKFNAWRPTGVGLGKHLGWAIGDELERAQVDPHQALLIPVPMHRLRRMARGVDHTLVLARSASVACGVRVRPVLRARHRPEQVGLSPTARALNIRDAFFVSRRARRALGGDRGEMARVWVLIDDVRTTGATFVSASRALRAALRASGMKRVDQPQIWVCSVGVAGERRRVPEPVGGV